MKNALTGRWAFDSQLFVYALDGSSPFYPPARRLFELIGEGKIQPIVAQQNLLEVESILVRALKREAGSVGLTVEKMIKGFGFRVIQPLPTTYARCRQLAKTASARLDIFDTYLAATLLDNGQKRLLTANTKDFKSFPEMEVINPLPLLAEK